MTTRVRNGLALVALCAVMICRAQNDAALHPAFVKLPAHYSEAWSRGEQDAERKRDVNTFLNRFRKGIGSISTFLGSETVSFAWYIPPEYAAYYYGHEGRRFYKSEQELNATRQLCIPSMPIFIDRIRFRGIITLWPSFGLYGIITRYPDPNDLADVRVVLRVGDRVIQPIRQPGNLLQYQGEQFTSAFIPRTQTTTSTTSGYYTGNYFWGSGSGTSYGYFSSTTTNTSYYIQHIAQGFTWYQGVFDVEFKIVDDQGNPLITEQDKEMTLIVIYGKNERHAKFKLSELINPTESKKLARVDEESRCLAKIQLALRLMLIRNQPDEAREILKSVEKTAQKYETVMPQFVLAKYVSLLQSNEKEAFSYAESVLVGGLWNNPTLLTTVAWLPFVTQAEAIDYRFVLKVARRACDLTKYENPYALVVLAHALYTKGEVAEALSYQEKAVSLAKQQNLPEILVNNLEQQYKKMKESSETAVQKKPGAEATLGD